MNKRIVITGIGVVSPIGIGTEAFTEALKQGKSGGNRISAFDASNYSTRIAAHVKDFQP
ncbi:MAG: beta-ketoacyl synthase N-terminal-like domain-containing protein, partial [Endomicrobiales bacterium]